MAADKFAICNMALSHLGQKPIVSFADGTVRSDLCSLHYDKCRDAALIECKPSFAKARFSEDTPAVTAPDWGYDNYFPVDADCIYVTQCRDDNYRDDGRSNIEWEFEGDFIAANATKIYYTSIQRITVTTKHSSIFDQALEYKLASVLAMPLTESSTKQTAMIQLYEMMKNNALGLDGVMGSGHRLRNQSLTNNVR